MFILIVEADRRDYAPRPDGQPHRWDEVLMVHGFDQTSFDLAAIIEFRDVKNLIERIAAGFISVSGQDKEAIAMTNDLCSLRHYDPLFKLESKSASLTPGVREAIGRMIQANSWNGPEWSFPK